MSLSGLIAPLTDVGPCSSASPGPRLAVLALLAALSGCAVGPDYREPQTTAADAWTSLPASGVRVESADGPSLAAWWTSLDDPTLNELIERALAENKTVKQALSRVAEARARRGVASADFMPSVNASAGASRTSSDSGRSSSTTSGFNFNSTNGEDIYDAGFDALWELDLFGGKRRAFEAATAQLGAAEADLRDALVTLLGDVALGYTNVRTAQARLTFAERNLKAQGEVLDIARWRSAAGLATALDVEQANASYEQTRAAIPQLESSLVQSINRVSVLTGQAPGALNALLVERKPLPAAPVDIVAGVPADVVRRRPDIRSAERRLAAQTAQVGVATAALYPSLSLTGSIGLQSLTVSDVLDGSQTDRLGLTLSMPIFRGGALRQNIRVQNALVDQALATYEQTVLAAFEEIDNTLAAWSNEQRRHAALLEAVASARRAAELALFEYNSGLVDFQTVVTADRQLITLEDSLAVSEGELTANLIRLYKALGGGWSVWQ